MTEDTLTALGANQDQVRRSLMAFVMLDKAPVQSPYTTIEPPVDEAVAQ